MKRTRLFWGIVVLIPLISGCFRQGQSLSVIGYRHQNVYIKKDLYYKVGPLSDDWKWFKTRAKAAAFHNEQFGSTISTDAFCGRAFEDLPLNVLTSQLFAGIKRDSDIKEKSLELDGRGALRSQFLGELDGVQMKYDTVVIKKNNCTIDFVYISPPEKYEDGKADFESFFSGFKFE